MSTEKKADFSGVTATVDSTEQKAADFSAVTATVDSTEEIIGERTYTVETGDQVAARLGSRRSRRRLTAAVASCFEPFSSIQIHFKD